MSANVVTLLAAIVAVVGTLTSPVLTQHYATRARQQELEAAKEQRLEERVEALQRTSLLD
jgi:DNA-binding FrmR family transcriptional regulator